MKTRSNRGRKPVAYTKEELEREPLVILVTGENTVGKRNRTKQEINHYLQDLPELGKKGRKVLIVDDQDALSDIRTVSPSHLGGLTQVSPRRIRPYNTDGTPMTQEDKQEVLDHIIRKYRNGLVVLSGVEIYANNAKGKTLMGQLLSTQNAGRDLMVSFSSISKISKELWPYCVWLRMHHQVEELFKYKRTLPRYSLLRVAQLIINEHYDRAQTAYDRQHISAEEHERLIGFSLYVNLRAGKIRGCSQPAFIRAAKKYIDQEEQAKLKLMVNEEDEAGLPKYKDKQNAVVHLIMEMGRMWDHGTQHQWVYASDSP